MSEPSLLAVKDMKVSYGSVTAVQHADFTLGAGEVIALLGPNGAGKSSVLKGIAGTARTSGSIRFNGAEISRRAAYRRVHIGIAMVPQARRLFSDLSVEENLLVAIRGRGIDRTERMQIAWDHFPRLFERRAVAAGYLSGGEQQMLALGRALMMRPSLILLDEPSLGLAPIIVTSMFEKIREIVATNVSAIIVDQNATQAISIADRVCVVSRGELVYNAPAEQAKTELNVVNAHLGLR